jgi:hypothetical protein
MPTQNSWNSNIPVEISKGGSNATSMANTDGVCYFDGTRIVTTTVGTAQQVLTSNGAGVAPTFQTSIQKASLTLTSQQIKNIHATPIELIPAPGANEVIVITNHWVHFVYGGTSAFTAAASQAITMRYNLDLTLAVGLITVSNAALVATADRWSAGGGTSLTSFVVANKINGSSMVLYNSVATEISGNAADDNSINIVVTYYVASL